MTTSHAHRPSKTRPRRDGENGGAVVEFAIVLPIFLALLFGAVDYGWYFYQRYAMAAAVRDGIRNGLQQLSTATPPADAWNVAKLRAIAVLTTSNTIPNPGTAVTWGGGYNGTAPTKTVTLSATYTFVPLIGFVPLPSTPMNYSMTMFLEAEN